MTIENLTIFPVLLAGGSGTRLWPFSRARAPKQLSKIGGDSSLLQETIQRLHPALCLDNVRVVCGKAHCDESSEHLASIGLSRENTIIDEPVGRNTAPAILLAVLKILHQTSLKEALFFILPADHVIGDVARFHEMIRKAILLAQKGYLVTFGIQPDYPETGYGYIQGNEPVHEGGFTIEKFVEKPDMETAKAYVAAGNFFWNSGMFAFMASTILNEFRRFEPDMTAKMMAIVKKDVPISLEAYQALPSVPFDVAIMEKTSKGVVLPSDFAWSDIGTWNSLYDHMPKDADGNVVVGDVISHNTQNSLIIANSRLVAANDMSNTAIVETPDAIFVSSLDRSRDVKDIVSILKQQNRPEYQVHLLEPHVWGTIQHLEKSDRLIVAKLWIKPNAVYRESPYRSGRWYLCLLSGHAQVAHDGTQHGLQAGDTLSLTLRSELTIMNYGENDISALIVHLKKS
jgi:mannose-1-phosphate guanylyltransferase/mannose-6-phosphate isomerase